MGRCRPDGGPSPRAGRGRIGWNTIKRPPSSSSAALDATPNFGMAHSCLGDALLGQGRLEEAIAQYRKALELKPVLHSRWEIIELAETHDSLGKALTRRGQLDEALVHYQKALEINPYDVEAHNNLGDAFTRLGRFDAAIAHYRQAVELQPDDADVHFNLGNTLAGRGRLDEAIAQFQRVLEIRPDDAEAHNNLGAALQLRGRIGEAMAQYQRALEIAPSNARNHFNLGNVLAGRGRFEEAAAQFQQALKLKPDEADAHNGLAWLRATCPRASLRSGVEALEHAQRANQLCGGKRPDVLNTLAAAYAEAGRFPEALATAHKALDLAVQQNKRALADAVRTRIPLLRSRTALSCAVVGFRTGKTLTAGSRSAKPRSAVYFRWA